MVAVVSSAITDVSWQGGRLTVTFRDGRTHTYNGVPEEEYEKLVEAASIGGYFNSNIRNKY